jgi:hypothetical protein
LLFLFFSLLSHSQILAAIIGSVFVFAIPFPAGYLGLLLGIFFTQNAMGLAVMNALGTLFGGMKVLVFILFNFVNSFLLIEIIF